MRITIKKPLYDNYVCLYSARVEEAIKKGEPLEITIPQGTGVHNPQEWKEHSKVIYKTFLRPDEPMKLFCGYVKFKTEEDHLREMAQQGVFG